MLAGGAPARRSMTRHVTSRVPSDAAPAASSRGTRLIAPTQATRAPAAPCASAPGARSIFTATGSPVPVITPKATAWRVPCAGAPRSSTIGPSSTMSRSGMSGQVQQTRPARECDVMTRPPVEPGTEEGWRVIDAAARSARAHLGDALLSAYAIGSLAHGGFTVAVSDVDIALLTGERRRRGRCEAVVNAIAADVADTGVALGGRLSVFHAPWDRFTDPPHEARFPPIDRYDLVRYGILVDGDDLRDRYAAMPSADEIRAQAVESALGRVTREQLGSELRRLGDGGVTRPRRHQARAVAGAPPACLRHRRGHRQPRRRRPLPADPGRSTPVAGRRTRSRGGRCRRSRRHAPRCAGSPVRSTTSTRRSSCAWPGSPGCRGGTSSPPARRRASC